MHRLFRFNEIGLKHLDIGFSFYEARYTGLILFRLQNSSYMYTTNPTKCPSNDTRQAANGYLTLSGTGGVVLISKQIKLGGHLRS